MARDGLRALSKADEHTVRDVARGLGGLRGRERADVGRLLGVSDTPANADAARAENRVLEIAPVISH